MEGAASQRRLGEKRLLGMRKSTFRWLLVVSAFFSQFFTSGANWAYGIYSAYYCTSNMLGTDEQQRLCALPGSLGVGAWSIFGLIVGRIADDPRIGFRATALFGAIVWAAANVIASFSTNYGLTVFAQGLLLGMGASFCYFPTLSIITHYFKKSNDSRGAALGIAISGTGCGGFALAAGTEAMIARWGVGWALRATGIIGGAVLIVTGLLLVPVAWWDEDTPSGVHETQTDRAHAVIQMKDAAANSASEIETTISSEVETDAMTGGTANSTVRTEVAEQRTDTALREFEFAEQSVDTAKGESKVMVHEETSETQTNGPIQQKRSRPPLRAIVTSKPFILASTLIFIMPWGSMAPSYWGASYSMQTLGLSPSAAAFQVSILNIASTAGRALQGALAERTGGPATNLFFSVFFAGLLQLIWWPFVNSQAMMSAYMAFQGLAGGSYNGVLSQVVAANFKEDVVATALSMSFSFFTIGSLVGPVVQGAIADIHTVQTPNGPHTDFIPTMMFSGATVVFASVFALWLRQHMSDGKIWVVV